MKMKFFNRKKKKTTRKKTSLLKQASPYFMKILPFIIIICAFLIVGKLLKDYIQSSEYFEVEGVDLYIDGVKANPDVKDAYNVNVNSNIFSVDLGYLQGRLKREHPEALRIWTWRLLPNRIVVDVMQRKPIAQVFYGRRSYYLIDTEGMILTERGSIKEKGLCVLLGIEGKTGRVSVGKRCRTKNFRQALELLQAVERSPLSDYLKECTIDCTDPGNLLIFTKEGVEVRMGKEDYKRKLVDLARAFSRLKDEAGSVKYIDMRFEGVVIGPKLDR